MKEERKKEKKLTCFTQTTSLCSCSAGSLASRQVHQTQLTHIHLALVLQFKNENRPGHSKLQFIIL